MQNLSDCNAKFNPHGEGKGGMKIGYSTESLTSVWF